MIDLGGIHDVQSGEFFVDTLNLTQGNFRFDIFHCNRHTPLSCIPFIYYFHFAILFVPSFLPLTLSSNLLIPPSPPLSCPSLPFPLPSILPLLSVPHSSLFYTLITLDLRIVTQGPNATTPTTTPTTSNPTTGGVSTSSSSSSSGNGTSSTTTSSSPSSFSLSFYGLMLAFVSLLW